MLLRYIPVAEYVIGLCHYGKYGQPHKTVVVEADSLAIAMQKGRKLLSPSAVQTTCHVETRPNPKHVAYIEQLKMERASFGLKEKTMDPEQTLKEIHEGLKQWCLAGTEYQDVPTRGPLTAEEIDSFFESVAGMDCWLSEGGFLPKDWERKA